MASSDLPSILPTHQDRAARFCMPIRLAWPADIDPLPCLGTLGSNLKRFLLSTWSDWLLIFVVGGTAACVWIAPSAFTLYFPLTSPDGAIYRTDLAYPYHRPIFSSAIAGILCAGIPLTTFAAAQIWQRSFHIFAAAVLGLAYSMVTGTCLQVILKKTVGGLRPHFLTVCHPVFSDGRGVGFHGSMFTAEEVCRGDRKAVRNALESFPSGHAEAAFAGLGYTALFLAAHLRVAGAARHRPRPAYWRLLVVVAPLLFATYLSGTLVLGHHHHIGDVMFGAFIGAAMAVLGYGIVFRGVFDPCWNTVPHPRLLAGGGDEEDTTEEVDEVELTSVPKHRRQSE